MSPDESVKEANVEETPAGSHTAVEGCSPPNNNEEGHTLCWDGFMSPVEDQPFEETTAELVADGAGSKATVSGDGGE